MIPDAPAYEARIAEIRERLSLPQRPGASFFVQIPRTELIWIQVRRRHWFFWEREENTRGIKLLSDLIYWSAELGDWVIELAGITSDGASVPQVFWSIMPPFGKDSGSDYQAAAIGHDKYCRQGAKGISPIDYRQAALLFREMMQVLEVRKRVRVSMYRAVRHFGPRFPAQKNLGARQSGY